MKRLLAAVLVWPLLALLAVPAYAVGLAVIVRDCGGAGDPMLTPRRAFPGVW